VATVRKQKNFNRLKLKYMNEISKEQLGNKANTLLYTGRCLIRNRMTNDVFLLDNVDEALIVATKENLKDEEHSSFHLYSADKNGKCKLVAELVRNFGHSELYWKPVKPHFTATGGHGQETKEF
jgi:NifB/MoaA-like Fe-S oxidoreductase